MKHADLIVIVGALLVSGAIASQESPYVGREWREIKALSSDAVAGYLAGHGQGLAMAAELNSHPGPRHVLELREALDLSAEQVDRTQAAFDRMHAEAVRLGRRLVDGERSLDRMFAEGRAEEEPLRALVAEIGRLRGELRFVHLEAHVEMRRTLTDEQIAAYDELRGYRAGGAGHHHGRLEHGRN